MSEKEKDKTEDKKLRRDRYWEEYESISGKRMWGYFDGRFSHDIALGRVEKVAVEGVPKKWRWEGVFSIRPKEKERFGTLKEAKEFVQSQYLVWVLDGGSLKCYYDDDDQTSPQRFLAVLYYCCGDWDIEAAPDYMKKVNHWKPAE